MMAATSPNSQLNLTKPVSSLDVAGVEPPAQYIRDPHSLAGGRLRMRPGAECQRDRKCIAFVGETSWTWGKSARSV
jgi:hypothetical protein